MKTHAQNLRKHALPPIYELRKRFSYDPETGEMTGPSGRVLRAKGNGGYLIVNLVNGQILQHRLAFALRRGRWPVLIDHINGVKTDNRWCNLREVSNAANTRRAFIVGYARTWRVTHNSEMMRFHRFCDAASYAGRLRAAELAGKPLPPPPPKAERAAKVYATAKWKKAHTGVLARRPSIPKENEETE